MIFKQGKHTLEELYLKFFKKMLKQEKEFQMFQYMKEYNLFF